MGQLTLNEQITEVEGGSILTPNGFTAAGFHTKVKRKRKDLGVILSDQPASAAAVYTLNQIQAAPLQVTKESIAEDGTLQAIVVNSGNANSCTGEQGMKDALQMREKSAATFGLAETEVAVTSTGVIGEPMPMDKIIPGIEALKPGPTFTEADAFNEAILTTDKVKKHACFRTSIDGEPVAIGGTAKGSGMIHPNMATMLSFITTDANISPYWLQHALSTVTDKTFNRITVDGDTSTNDMVVVMANGHAKHEPLNPEHSDWHQFLAALKETCEILAKKIARDGEGASKLVEVQVSGAVNDEEAGQVAKQVVGSDLVKTAVYGTDANWGRIICAIGYSGATINPETIDIAIGPIQTLKDSRPVSFSEEEATAYLQQDTVTFHVDLQQGDGFAKAWGCDLSYEYVRINAGYRT
ncbi:bifunctional glutamate N-acetyltransferase/amino-acid acetyltransferase ArgJ [Salsuginibacillus kocurii]|uniref:bifunctional glutamate N-acetyltransferase/amino-acid acetyltransferase ArgJ n=1 Tax=Salsuginibacillus kocurii TaxID=427078 RepID=UPI0003718F46|nr:bifunctional glutamate N-acetyltransferase/amino-acid acetyltransferase ArgJ [Salsuginibacillus kocurii]